MLEVIPLSDGNDPVQLRRTVNALTILAGGLAATLADVVGEHGGAAITYNLGANAGKRIADRVGKLEKLDLALNKLLPETKGIYDIKIKELKNQQDGQMSGVLEMQGCFIREVLKKRGLKVGGILCRITRGYFETALAKMTGRKVTLRLLEGSESGCLSSISFESASQKK